MKQNIKVIKNKEKPESKEILAEAIVRISESFLKLQESGLNEKAIIALIYDYSKVSKSNILLVLNSLRKLKSWYCK